MAETLVQTLLVHPTETQIFHLLAGIYSPTLPANKVHQMRVLHEAIDVAGQIIPWNFLLLACHPYHEVHGRSATQRVRYGILSFCYETEVAVFGAQPWFIHL